MEELNLEEIHKKIGLNVAKYRKEKNAGGKFINRVINKLNFLKNDG
jgi:hypothetical protein